jgi:pullulanase/glycogen debranching enzyme
MIVDLSDPALAPAGWGTVAKPPLAAPENIALYELHVRDFTINDTTLPEDARGTFKAFTYPDANGMEHLKSLAAAGLTHEHLLQPRQRYIKEDRLSRGQLSAAAQFRPQ